LNRTGYYVQDDMGQSSEVSTPHLVDAPLPREKAMREAMWRGHGGYELALSPVILGGFGWLLDGVVGWSPAFLIVGVVLGFVGATANQYYRYKAAMEIENESRLAKSSTLVEASPSTTQSFGRVEPVEVDMSIDFSVTDSSQITDSSNFTGQVSQ